MSKLLDIPTFQGLTVNGKLLGTRVQKGRPDANGQTRNTLYCGIEVEKTNSYGASESVIFDIVIIPAKLALMNETQVSLPIWNRVWQGTKSAGVTMYLANEVEALFQ
jgi:hypothetical protein